uniref:Uncharacterized protein n=1 Tax=Cannabis sativa TaxID=3483 RepID=A0A803QMJ2_CANSA
MGGGSIYRCMADSVSTEARAELASLNVDLGEHLELARLREVVAKSTKLKNQSVVSYVAFAHEMQISKMDGGLRVHPRSHRDGTI